MCAAADRPRRPDYPFTSQWFTHTDGSRQHYVDEGTGPPVLMVHGNPSWSYAWRHLIAALSDAYRCIAPDLLGMGLSERLAPPLPALLAGHQTAALDDLVRHLTDEHGAPRHGWTVVAHDWGGPIALTWACLNADKVDRVVVLNTAVFRFPEHGLPPWWFRLLHLRPVSTAAAHWTPGWAHGAARLGVTTPMPPPVRRAFTAPYRRRRRRAALARFIQDVPITRSDPGWALLAVVERMLPALDRTPMLVGWGMRDPVLRPPLADVWQQRFPHAHVLRFPDAGHYVLEDARAELVPAIRHFLDTTGERR
ncbi:alpha/beta fold hydrolase [Streptomyces morookaense]|uniref:Alpha/beta fold hydrolase n=1 Tax=Streptomyces morookaense TaxID=1970 RepID=A0A7Y7BAW8_STRMO|nr:alpha/beta fold hydrolase [Streptomyces morookaense]NVK82252.1 alpha/beta fold hydrolase [Streptomyces morookaense]GHF53660.1 haloalkane dehalogenase [Streptomyces morookaense]